MAIVYLYIQQASIQLQKEDAGRRFYEFVLFHRASQVVGIDLSYLDTSQNAK